MKFHVDSIENEKLIIKSAFIRLVRVVRVSIIHRNLFIFRCLW